MAKKNLATAMIDVSDGLLQDLGHICQASGIGAVILHEQLPLSPAYRSLCGQDGTRHALSGGEDYELLFCARRRNRARIERLSRQTRLPISRIGACVAGRGVVVVDSGGKDITPAAQGHDHFQRNSRAANAAFLQP